MVEIDRSTIRNHLLTLLPQSDFELLFPQLEKVDLPFQRQIDRANREIEHIYFPECGIASVVTTDADERSIEIGLVGREGCTGLPAVLGAGKAPQEIFMQLLGNGWRIRTADLLAFFDQAPASHKILLRYAHCFMVQISHTALANARSKLEDRLIRWLLMAHDRAETDEFTVTHEFLSIMLGVRRPGVTIALQMLESSGMIKTQRGAVIITDRKGLLYSANGSYGVAEAEYDRVMNAA